MRKRPNNYCGKDKHNLIPPIYALEITDYEYMECSVCYTRVYITSKDETVEEMFIDEYEQRNKE